MSGSVAKEVFVVRELRDVPDPADTDLPLAEPLGWALPGSYLEMSFGGPWSPFVGPPSFPGINAILA